MLLKEGNYKTYEVSEMLGYRKQVILAGFLESIQIKVQQNIEKFQN